MRRLGADGATESYTAILDEPAGKQVVARRIEPWLRDDPRHMSELEARIRDLQTVRHPSLISTMDLVEVEGERYIISDWVDGVSVRQLLFWCQANKESLPHNIYLDIATRICNGLEALHSRPGANSSTEHVLHLGLSPECVILKPDGGVVVGVYGLVRSPTVSSGGAAAGVNRVEYLSPEQTHPDQALTPATDIFALGATLYELLTLKPLFKAGSRLQTMHRIRRAEVTTQLLEVKELLPGLDKVLYRALSLNPRHRYQRAFVLREDLRGLMAGYSFSDIEAATKDFLAPLIAAKLVGDTDELMPNLPPAEGPPETTDALLENSLQNLELPPGFFQEEAKAPVAIENAPDTLDEPAHDAPSDDDTGALLRRTNRPGDTTGDVLVDELLQEPGAGTPLPQRRTEAPPAPSAGDLPDGPDPTDVPEPAGMVPLEHAGVPPVDDDVENTIAEGPAPEEVEVTDVNAGAPQGDHTSWIRRDVPADHTQESVDVAQAAQVAAEASGEPQAKEEPQAVVQVPEPPEPSVELPEGGLTPPPNQTPPPAEAQGGQGRPSNDQTRPMERPIRPQPTDDDWSDLDYQPGGAPAWAFGLAAGVAVGIVAFFCAGFGLYNFASGLGSASESVEVAATDPDPGIQTAEAPAPEPLPSTPEPVPEPDVVATTAPAPKVRPRPLAPTPRPQPAVRPSPPPAPTPVRSPPPAPTPKPVPVAAPEPPPPPPVPDPMELPEPEPSSALVPDRFEDDAVALAELATDDEDPLPLDPVPVAGTDAAPAELGDLDALSASAHAGTLTPVQRDLLEGVDTEDPEYSRARVLLYQDAKTRGSTVEQRKHIEALMVLPENHYRPEYLVEEAQMALMDRDYDRALARAELAERHWARLPRDLVFSKRASIFEIEAAAHTGLFYASDGEDMQALERAIRVWEKYKRHVLTRQRSDLQRHADTKIEKLADMRARIQ